MTRTFHNIHILWLPVQPKIMFIKFFHVQIKNLEYIDCNVDSAKQYIRTYRLLRNIFMKENVLIMLSLVHCCSLKMVFVLQLYKSEAGIVPISIPDVCLVHYVMKMCWTTLFLRRLLSLELAKQVHCKFLENPKNLFLLAFCMFQISCE